MSDNKFIGFHGDGDSNTEIPHHSEQARWTDKATFVSVIIVSIALFISAVWIINSTI